jgi:serine/threonine-protein kinase HipA
MALSTEELHDKINQLPTRPFLVGEEGIRLSLAGAQNKLPVYVKNNQIHLPLYTSPSSHILKIPIPNLEDTIINEAFCMTLAKRMGLPVPSVIIHQGIEMLYLVERYDRIYNQAGQLMRLHQEDFCQALGISPDFKYEAEGGPSLQNCFKLVREYSSQPASDVKALLDWVIFNYFIGNADGHAKNLALLMTNDGLRLAPFYDLICTRIYPELTSRLAMKIGNENRPNWIMARHWKKFANQVDIQAKWVINTLHRIIQILPDRANQLANEYQATYGTTPFLAKMVKVIENQVHQTLLALSV